MRVSWYVAVATFSTVVLSQGFSEQIPQCAVRALHQVSLNLRILSTITASLFQQQSRQLRCRRYRLHLW
jgi:hypothetical protein